MSLIVEPIFRRLKVQPFELQCYQASGTLGALIQNVFDFHGVLQNIFLSVKGENKVYVNVKDADGDWLLENHLMDGKASSAFVLLKFSDRLTGGWQFHTGLQMWASEENFVHCQLSACRTDGLVGLERSTMFSDPVVLV